MEPSPEESALDVTRRALQIAEEQLSVPPLLCAEDFIQGCDTKSMVLYLSCLWHATAGTRVALPMSSFAPLQRRIALEEQVSTMTHEYELQASSLQAWVAASLHSLGSRVDARSMDEVRQLRSEFQAYLTEEKRGRFEDFSATKQLMFTTQSLLAGSKVSLYLPPEGIRVSDLNTSWSMLEVAEAARDK